MIVAGGGTIAYQRSFKNPRTESANGISLAKRKRRASKITPRNGHVSERFATNVIRGIDQQFTVCIT